MRFMRRFLISLLAVLALAAGSGAFAAENIDFYISKRSVTIQGISETDTLIIALYNDDTLTDVRMYRGSGQLTADYADDMKETLDVSNRLKAFVWKMDELKPSCPSVDRALAELPDNAEVPAPETDNKLYIKVNETTLTATLVENSSTAALKELLAKNDITINMSDYGDFEKVGSLGASLPRNDEHITTESGDLILYQGNSITIYYDTNTWNFTRLGKIDNVTQGKLKQILGDGDVTVTFSLNN